MTVQEAPTGQATENAQVPCSPVVASSQPSLPGPTPPTSTQDVPGANIHIVTNPPSVFTSAEARTTYPALDRVTSADDVHSLAGSGPIRINLFHKEDKDPFRPA